MKEKIFEQEYENGVPQYPVREIGVSERTGTTVHFWPDADIFTITDLQQRYLEGRLRELSYLNRKISIILTDLQGKRRERKDLYKSILQRRRYRGVCGNAGSERQKELP